jgi:signal transduction histidine kinase
LTPTSLDIGAQIQNALELFGPRAESEGIALDTILPDSPLYVQADESALQRILHNLLSNALKFTGAGGSVEVRARDEGDTVGLVVSDTGIGIDPGFRDELFDPFKQGKSGTDRPYEGSGLGLAVTKQLLDHLDGSIEVESTPGEGTVFHIHLPKADR